MNYPKHKHPHGVENTKPNEHRVWICDECYHVFTDEEIREDKENGEWGHKCASECDVGCHHIGDCRCESHLEPYIPDVKSIKENSYGE